MNELKIPEDLKDFYAALTDAPSHRGTKRLIERIARLEAPVSDEEADVILGPLVSGRGDYAFKIAVCGFFNEVMAARKTQATS